MVRTLAEVPAWERLALVDMSYSRLNSYDMCASKYFYTYILRSPDVFSAPATLGTIVHGVLEDTISEPERYELGEMAAVFEDHRAVRDPEFQIDDTLVDRGLTMLSEFYDRHPRSEWDDVVATEMPFEIVIGAGLIRGFIDRVDRTRTGIAIVDYKTGAHEVAAKNVPTDLQLGIYALACSVMFPDVDRFTAELYYLRSGRRKHHTFTRADLEDVEARVATAITTVLEDRFFHETKNPRICGFCEHATTGVCRYGVVQRSRSQRG